MAKEASNLERAFETRWLQLSEGFPDYVPEYRFMTERRFKFDCAWIEQKVAVELEGGTRTGGRHVRGDGYAMDCVKYNFAVLMGWAVLRYTADMLNNDPITVIEQIKWLLEQRGAKKR
jgi:very-short-patch-repair endonuclease